MRLNGHLPQRNGPAAEYDAVKFEISSLIRYLYLLVIDKLSLSFPIYAVFSRFSVKTDNKCCLLGG